MMASEIGFYTYRNRNFTKNRFKSGPKDNNYVAFAVALEELGYVVNTIDLIPQNRQIDLCFVFDIPSEGVLLKLLKRKITTKIAVLREADMVCPMNYDSNLHKYFDAIFTWKKDLVDDVKYFYLPIAKVNLARQNVFCEGRRAGSYVLINKRQKINADGELYSEREKFLRLLTRQNPTSVDIFGFGWDRHILMLGRNIYFGRKKDFLNFFKGPCADKIETLGQYDFAVCFENFGSSDYYVSEKIFDCFLAGCVPIYLGAKKIDELIPPGCYVHCRDFESYEKVIEYTSKLSPEKMESYRNNIKNFLNSTGARSFTNVVWQQTLITFCLSQRSCIDI